MTSSAELIEDPVIVVGQPRSGSTLVTRVLNEDTGLFVINDFYVLQKIDAHGLWGPLSSASATKIARWIYDRIEIRSTEELGKTISQSIDMQPAELALLKEFVEQPFADGVTWGTVFSRVLGRAAALAGCARWGYNTPQDHLHLGRIFAEFPQAKVLFVLRKPAAVLRSYKNADGPWHDGRRYNPLTIGLAWRAAAKSYLHWHSKKPNNVAFVSYESVTGDLSHCLGFLGSFLGVPFGALTLDQLGNNSSFSPSKAVKPVQAMEIWSCETIIGKCLQDLGFERSVPVLTFSGATEFMFVMARSGLFIGKQIISDKDRRRRAFNFLGVRQ